MQPTDRPAQPLPIFNQYVPADFQRGLLQTAIAASQEGLKRCDQDFEESEVHDLAPHCIRAIFERDFRSLGRTFGGTALARRNKKKTAYHSVVSFKKVIITASRVPSPETIVRWAEFREGLATSPQLELFTPPQPPDFTKPLYALFIYGSDETKRYPIGFAEIVFPFSDCKSYAYERINLCAKFTDIIERLDAPMENIPDTATPRLKTGIEKVQGL